MDFEDVAAALWFCLLTTLLEVSGFEGEWSIPVEYSCRGVEKFAVRGSVRISQQRPDAAFVGTYAPAADFDARSLRRHAAEAVAAGRRCFVRCGASLREPRVDAESVMSFADPCRLLRSNLHEVLTLSVDASRQRVASISSQPVLMHAGAAAATTDCSADDDDDGEAAAFNTTVRIVNLVEGPSPETQAYIQKAEKEKHERERGTQPDNRSFLAKYWMYIVPVVIFITITSAMNPEAQGGGGGGGG